MERVPHLDKVILERDNSNVRLTVKFVYKNCEKEES